METRIFRVIGHAGGKLARMWLEYRYIWKALSQRSDEAGFKLNQREVSRRQAALQSVSVKTPVPGPSSNTLPVEGSISLVISRASRPPEGTIAPISWARREVY
ncbi:hypothetical protein [Rhizobium sp. BK377]|uniref:hypothetical protein n=1 Tax=Rhizobium sp. BK377 TaxID=2587058 RepID=UPI0016202EA2|nr:hypothetical protein [Rhizobium sp. BK377]MBB3462553.1 hypothetical protein [Rhizobium sp. BK377]